MKILWMLMVLAATLCAQTLVLEAEDFPFDSNLGVLDSMPGFSGLGYVGPFGNL